MRSSEYRDIRIFGIANHYATQCRYESSSTVEEGMTGSASAKNSVELSGCCNLDAASVLDWRAVCSADQPVCGFSDHGRADS